MATPNPLFTGTGDQPNLYANALDKKAEFALVNQPVLHKIADKAPVSPTNVGKVVEFLFHDFLDASIDSSLLEKADVDPTVLGNPRKVTLTQAEYGKAVRLTKQALLFDISTAGAMGDATAVIAQHMNDTKDRLARAALMSGTAFITEKAGVMTAGGTANDVTGTDTLKARDIAAAVNALRGKNVMARQGSLYHAYVHPDQTLDLKQETGATAWISAVNAQDKRLIDLGVIEVFNGVAFIENPGLKSTANGGGVKVYTAHIVGREAVAEVATDPAHFVVKEPVDSLNRFYSVGWTGTFGYAKYRDESIVNIRTASSALSL